MESVRERNVLITAESSTTSTCIICGPPRQIDTGRRKNPLSRTPGSQINPARREIKPDRPRFITSDIFAVNKYSVPPQDLLQRQVIPFSDFKIRRVCHHTGSPCDTASNHLSRTSH